MVDGLDELEKRGKGEGMVYVVNCASPFVSRARRTC